MTEVPYLDTSALAKWYLPEAGSAAFEAYIQTKESAVISTLVQVEFKCLLARRQRAGELDDQQTAKIYAVFSEDARRGFLQVMDLDARCFEGAVHLISALHDHSLRSLDALHLAAMTSGHLATLATADRVMAGAAKDLGLQVVRFDPGSAGP